SIFFDCLNSGSRVEKKKFSSTTGRRSTKNATQPKRTAVVASASQRAPNQIGLLVICANHQSHARTKITVRLSDFAQTITFLFSVCALPRLSLRLANDRPLCACVRRNSLDATKHDAKRPSAARV